MNKTISESERFYIAQNMANIMLSLNKIKKVLYPEHSEKYENEFE